MLGLNSNGKVPELQTAYRYILKIAGYKLKQQYQQ
jgi:hypothetical protein